MNFLSFNSCGLKAKGKLENICSTVRKENCCLLALQETKSEGFDETFIRQIWGKGNFDFVFGGSCGSSGGTLLVWDTDFFLKEKILGGEHFCGAVGYRKGCDKKLGVINVYGPQLSIDKMSLWLALKEIILSLDCIWIIAGDFNVVRYKEERAGIDFGPKPFRVFDRWLSEDGFADLVETSWNSSPVTGFPDWVLFTKLRILKQDIRRWAKEESEKRCRTKESLIQSLTDWDLKAESGDLATDNKERRESILFELSQVVHKENLDLRQKSRIRWALEGDENSKFFHASVNQRWRNRNLKGLICDGVWTTDPKKIMETAHSHFALRFKEPNSERPSLVSPLFKRVSATDASYLDSPFSYDEIEMAVKSCDDSKAPGPDGLNFKFIKRFWPTLKDTFVDAIMHFCKTGHLGRGSNSSFLALVPKRNDPLELSDFRPISLIGCFYKIISKLLASRLAKFADDALFLGKWSRKNVKCLTMLLHCFYDVSGLKLNISKCNLLGIGVEHEDVKALARELNCHPAELPFIYLGLPVGSNMKKISSWDSIINRFNKKLANWKAATLSIGGRLTLVKSVLSSLPLYYASIFKIPENVLQTLEGKRRRFLWGIKDGVHKQSWISWNKVVASKVDGGLGVTSIKARNLALLAKWYWRFISENGSLWKEVIVEIHGESGGFNSTSRLVGNGIWSSIIKNCKKLKDYDLDLFSSFHKSVTNGSCASFWHEPFAGIGDRLSNLFPRLYALESNKSAPFSDRWMLVNGIWRGNWDWRSDLRGRSLTEFNEMLNILSKAKFQKLGSDRWLWNWDHKGFFTVSKLSFLIQRYFTFQSAAVGLKSPWLSSIPLKVNVFLWRLFNNALPLKMVMVNRGVPLASTACVFCDSREEDLQHCFFLCPRVETVWRKIWSWWGITIPRPTALEFLKFDVFTDRKNDFSIAALKATCVVALWHIWAWRNKIFHAEDSQALRIKLEDPFASIQKMSGFWLANRCRKISIDVDSWVASPLAALQTCIL
ncbi:hypothetical protein OSB04_029232 [Centaurea solstitialis]|uniref:Uncharacterized protein n=1 Tax=Centaurea solstitialis TaxID=347529 RepID=A0AA38SU54_9ASTR|nr:hypothetical protein OSB04_029232 [Centaurea solstitialis]